MPNEFIEAFNELLDVQEKCLGERPSASIGGVTCDVIIEEPQTDQTLIENAYSENGSTWIQCLASDFPAPPKFQAPVIMGERKLQVINVPESNHGIYRIQLGDPTRR